MKIDERKIERGLALKEMAESEGGELLLSKIDDLISGLKEQRDIWNAASLYGELMLVQVVHELRALKGLRQWIAEEIEDGSAELKKKQMENK